MEKTVFECDICHNEDVRHWHEPPGSHLDWHVITIIWDRSESRLGICPGCWETAPVKSAAMLARGPLGKRAPLSSPAVSEDWPGHVAWLRSRGETA